MMEHTVRPLRVYVDTSVIGGCFDEEFKEDSLRLMHSVRNGEVILLISAVVARELGPAPRRVVDLLQTLPNGAVIDVPLTEEVFALRDAYIAAGILDPKWSDDATHVAAATVARADAIVSWNFQHIVRLDKMRAFNQVNLLNGYGMLTIISPKEVRKGENEV